MAVGEVPNPIVGKAIDDLGGDTAVAGLAGLKTSWAVSKWRKRLPADRVLWLARQTGWKFTPHQLAPSLYPNTGDGLPQTDAGKDSHCPCGSLDGSKAREARGPVGRTPPDVNKEMT